MAEGRPALIRPQGEVERVRVADADHSSVLSCLSLQSDNSRGFILDNVIGLLFVLFAAAERRVQAHALQLYLRNASQVCAG